MTKAERKAVRNTGVVAILTWLLFLITLSFGEKSSIGVIGIVASIISISWVIFYATVNSPVILENGYDPEKTVRFHYTNYRGEQSIRTVIIDRIYWGHTDWHPEDGYLLKAYDIDKNEAREFALKDCDFTRRIS